MTGQSVVEQCRTALKEQLDTYGDPDATAEVLAKCEELPYTGDLPAYADAIADVARAVWEQKVAKATARVEELKRQSAAMDAEKLFPPSNKVH